MRSFNALRRLSPNCREAARLISEAHAHELSASDRVGLRLHVLICRSCRAYNHSIHILVELMRIVATKQYPGDADVLSEAAKERILHKLRSQL